VQEYALAEAGAVGVGAGAVAASRSVANGGAGQVRNTVELGRKLDFFFGRATGTAHNVGRSVQLQRQLERIGLSDSPTSRQYLTEHLTSVFADSTSIMRVQENRRVVRESLLMGPRGALKLETIWENNKLITAFPHYTIPR